MHHRDAPDAVRKYMYPFHTTAMTKQTFKAEDGSIIHYDTDTKEVRREEPKVVSPLLWKPKDGEDYWRMNGYGGVEGSYYLYKNQFDANCLATGNCYRTKEEAEQAREKKLAQVRVLRRIAELNEGWVPDWPNGNQNHYVLFDHDAKKFYALSEYGQVTASEWYLKSEEAADSLIASHSDDLKLIFGISKS